jgi:ABC-type amino acid transport system permease subunit
MIMQLLIGLPGERPGGLLLTASYFLGAGTLALAAGFVYAGVCTAFPWMSLPLQAAAAVVRGIPPLLLVFLLAVATGLSVGGAGLAGLTAYSFTHVGEALRSFLAAYPTALRHQARVMGLGPLRDWAELRVPRTLVYSLDALATHWVSLLKDSGALVVLSIGELTTVAKTLSESAASYERWAATLLTAGALYLATTLLLIAALNRVRSRPFAAALSTRTA